MTASAVIQIILMIVVLAPLSWILGSYMASVYSGGRTVLTPLLRPLEQVIYRLAHIDPDRAYGWQRNALELLVLNGGGILFLYVIMRLQAWHPWASEGWSAPPPHLAFSIAASFGTNTNWQAYGGETVLTPLTQALGLTSQNFLSAATGMAVAVQLFRGLAGQRTDLLGNFLVDVVRSILYILLPLAILLSVSLVSEGVVQTWRPPLAVPLLEAATDSAGAEVDHQVIARGPVASQIAIKQLGTNGGGYFNANAAHPFENPTPVTNILEMIAMLLIPASFCTTFGKMVGDVRQGLSLAAVMGVLFAAGAVLAIDAEQRGTPVMSGAGTDHTAGPLQSGGNMEGKEVRFGAAASALWAAATTATANGSVNSMHDSFTPLGGLALLVLMQLGEVAFGGVGSGMAGMLTFVVAALFVAGLLVGRTPEYLHKKIEPIDMKLVSILILLMPVTVLIGTAIAVVRPEGTAAVLNSGAHGFSEILYAYTSLANNNGSAFAGLNAGTPFYTIGGGIIMLLNRYWSAVVLLALAGSFARKNRSAAGVGALETHTPLFALWLLAVIVLVGALSFLPALAAGPVVEHILMVGG